MHALRVLIEDVSKPEGPVYLPDGDWVVTEMGRGDISRIRADGRARTVLANTGRPNGLALDRAGNLWVAESRHPALLKLAADGAVHEVTRGSADTPFLWPNDLCFGPDRCIYMTDSGVLLNDFEGIQPPTRAYEVDVDGHVFRIDPADGSVTLVDRGLRFANGIAFGPEAAHLYVSETLTGNIYRYAFDAETGPGARELFANVMVKPPVEHGRVAGPDGMAFDSDGHLYVAVLTQGDITVLTQDGGVKERIPLPGNFPTNVAFGPGMMLITEVARNQLLVLPTGARGLPLYA